MARKTIKPSKVTLFSCLLLLGAIILLLPQSTTNSFNFAFVRAFGFCLKPASSSARTLALPEGLGRQYVDRNTHNKLWIAYQNLQEDFYMQRRQLEKLAGLRVELPSPGMNLVPATITSRRKNDEIVINRGSLHNIAKGQYVLGNNSIVGLIAEASEDMASIKLITHPSCKIDIKIVTDPENDISIRRIMVGSKSNIAKIANVRRKYKVETDWPVYATQKTGYLATSRIIGRISKCVVDEDNPLIWDITVSPACNLDELADVHVIVMNEKPDRGS